HAILGVAECPGNVQEMARAAQCPQVRYQSDDVQISQVEHRQHVVVVGQWGVDHHLVKHLSQRAEDCAHVIGGEDIGLLGVCRTSQDLQSVAVPGQDL